MRYVLPVVVGLIVLSSIASDASAQIPNPGFENWIFGTPVGWLTDALGGLAPSPATTRSSDSHSGRYALRGDVVKVADSTKPPFAATWTFDIFAQKVVRGFKLNQAPTALRGWLKSNLVSNDVFNMDFYVTNDTGGTSGGGITIDPSSHATYTLFQMPILTFGKPDTGDILITLFNPLGKTHLGSFFELDDLSLVTTSSVSSGIVLPADWSLEQNYPNPASGTTTIQYSIMEPMPVAIEIRDIAGRLVERPLDQTETPGIHRILLDLSKLEPGVYTYSLIAGDRRLSKLLQVLR